MTMRKEIEIDAADLRYLSVTCARCATMVTIDLDGEENGKVDLCPHCHREFPEALPATLLALGRALQAAKHNPHKVSFRLPLKD